MNEPCNLVRDLLPLYHDGVCSTESADAVESHLEGCGECRAFYQALRDSDGLPPSPADRDGQKAASLRRVKRKLNRKKLLACALCTAVLVLGAVFVCLYLHIQVVPIEYRDNFTVTESTDGLTVRVQGEAYTQAASKLVETEENGRTVTALYFNFSTTLWDSLTTPEQSYSGYTLVPADKSPQAVDRVYYFTGDYQGLEDLDGDTLRARTADAVLVWERQAG